MSETTDSAGERRDGTHGLDTDAFETCPECGQPPIGFATIDTAPADVLNTHAGVAYEICTTDVAGATRVVFHARNPATIPDGT